METTIKKYLFDIKSSIDDETIWGIVINHLPKLKIEVEGFRTKGVKDVLK